MRNLMCLATQRKPEDDDHDDEDDDDGDEDVDEEPEGPRHSKKT